jgi:cell wall-associated NlpC family hydrolase
MSLAKYRPYVGVEYQAPHGCFKLVERLYREVLGIDLSGSDDGLEQSQNKHRTLRMQQKLQEIAVAVNEPQEGDVVVIRSRPWHIAYVIQPGLMLHSYLGGTSCIEDYNDPRWSNRIEGFYRYVSNSTGE